MIFKYSKSIAGQYLFYTKIVVVAFIIAALLFLHQAWQEEERKILQNMDAQASRIEATLNDTFDYVSFISSNAAEQIRTVLANNGGSQGIKAVLDSYQSENETQDIFAYTMINWVGSDNKVLVSSKYGILDKPIDISYRSFTKYVSVDPGHLKFSEVDTGNLSKRPIIPGGMGVVDSAGNYQGAVGFNVDIPKLTNRLVNSITSDGFSFALLSHNLDVVTDFPSNKFKGNSVYLEKLKSMSSSQRSAKKKVFTEARYLGFGGGTGYAMYVASSKYPYIILVTYDGAFGSKEVGRVLLPRIIELMTASLILLLFIIALHKKIITPIVTLSSAADQMSRGEVATVVLPGDSFIELNNLSEHLTRIGEYIRERKIVESELRSKTADLRSAKEQAEYASKSKSEFLAFMSHEIRTPLNAILAFSEIMKNGSFGPIGHEKYLEYASDIHKSGRYILGILSDLLDITKAESGLIELHREEIDLKALIEESVRIIADSAATRKIEIHTEFGSDLPHVYIDEIRIKQAVLNLLSNSIKFTREGGHIDVKAAISGKGDGRTLELEIADNGIGMDARDIPVALSKFGQVENGLEMNHEGIGLGLPITKMLIELHDGRFDLKSKKGKGTTSTIRFPLSKIAV